MSSQFDPVRYSIIEEKNKREIVMLRGSGCKWRKCRFCDYHLDFSKDENANFALNKKELEKVTGKYQKLEVINSGSFIDLDEQTMNLIEQVCINKQISELHFECHWMHRSSIPALRTRFWKHKINVKVKIGVETFDSNYRENILRKGLNEDDPKEIAEYFDEVCLLFGLEGQTAQSMKHDVETGLRYFERVCINIMVKNTTKILPCPSVIEIFHKEIYPLYQNDDRVDILFENTDFGVGGES